MPFSVPLPLPRWEWRTITPSLRELREHLAGVRIEQVRTIGETYLLCDRSHHNAKIRGEVLDLKWRKQVDGRGLELWDPVLKSSFPMEARVLPDLFGAWGLPLPATGRPAFTREQFLQEVVALQPELKVLEVQKVREGFSFEGTTCEFVQIAAGKIRLESFCVEHEDPRLVAAVLARLGLDPRLNLNYPQALKRAAAQAAA